MSDSNFAEIEKYLQKSVATATDALEKFKTIVKEFPAQCPQPTNYCPSGYCAYASLTFDTPDHFEALRVAFPAKSLIWLRDDRYGFTVKPRSALRERELECDYLEVFPVVKNYLGKLGEKGNALAARWWSSLGPYTVEILVQGVKETQFEPHLRDYYRIACHHTEAFLPKTLAPKAAPSALTKWRLGGSSLDTLEEARALELKQVAKMAAFLQDIFSLGYLSPAERDIFLYRDYLQHALVARTGVQARLDLFTDSWAGGRPLRARVYLDEAHLNESFYDLNLTQAATRKLRLRDIESHMT